MRNHRKHWHGFIKPGQDLAACQGNDAVHPLMLNTSPIRVGRPNNMYGGPRWWLGQEIPVGGRLETPADASDPLTWCAPAWSNAMLAMHFHAISIQ